MAVYEGEEEDKLYYRASAGVVLNKKFNITKRIFEK